MGRQDYITLITKALKVTDKIKYRILADIETEIECLLEKGLIMSEIISIKGTPVDVAKSFNDSYFGTAVAIQYNKQKLFNNIAICERELKYEEKIRHYIGTKRQEVLRSTIGIRSSSSSH